MKHRLRLILYPVLFTILSSVTNPCLASQFKAPTALPIFAQDGAAVADFNKDGKLDLVAVTQDGHGGTVLEVALGNGDGTFQAPVSTSLGILGPAGSLATLATVADLNADGKLDVVLFQVFSSTRTIFVSLGNGDGTFQPTIAMTVNSAYSSFVAADLNGDGKVDLAAVNFNDVPSVVSIFPGNGDGTLQQPVNISLSAEPTGLTVGDFNNDGKPDLAVADSSQRVSIFVNNGSGSFTLQGAFPTGSGSNTTPFPTVLATSDLNGDNNLDLVITDALDGKVSVLLGKGNGSFQPFTQFAAGTGVTTVGVGDLNEDGIPDLVVGNQDGNNLGVLLGNGDGTFKPMVVYGAGGRTLITTPMFVADFNQDGHPDVMFFVGFGQPALLFGAGDGTFPFATKATPVGVNPRSIAVADFNKDGKLDFITGNVGDPSIPAPGSVSVALGKGDGTFTVSTIASGVSPNGIATGDFNNDGNPDLVIANTTSNTVSVFLGNGDGTFRAPQNFTVDPNPNNIAVVDVNKDSKLDLVVTHGTFANHGGLASPERIAVLLGNGDGTFQAAQFSAPQQSILPLALAVADYNNDGNPDLVVADQLLGGQPYLLGTGSASFTANGFLGNDNAFWITAGDFTGDGKPDFAVPQGSCAANPPPFVSCARVFVNNGFGSAFTPVDTLTRLTGQFIVSGDFDADGKLDIALSYDTSVVSTMKGNGDGSLQPSVDYVAGSTILPIIVGDVNGDGAPDILAVDTFSNNVFAMLNVGTTPPVFPPDFGVSVAQTSTTIKAGQSATFDITLAGFGGYANQVNFSCSGLPALSNCSFNPPSLTPGGSPSHITLTVATSGPAHASASGNAPWLPTALIFTGLLAALVFVPAKSSRKQAGRALGILLVGCVLAGAGCGGGGGNPPPTPTPTPPPTTPSGTSLIVVHATSISGSKTIVHNIPLTVTVQ